MYPNETVEFKVNTEHIENNTNIYGLNKIDTIHVNAINNINTTHVNNVVESRNYNIHTVNAINVKYFILDTLSNKYIEKIKTLDNLRMNTDNFYIDISTRKVYTNVYLRNIYGTIQNTKFEIKFQCCEFSSCVVLLFMTFGVILIIISFSCYFSGWSNIVGGKLMLRKKFEITSVCTNNIINGTSSNGVYGYFNISENYYKYKYGKSGYECDLNGCKYICELYTGYSHHSRFDCLREFENKYKVGSFYDIYYNNFGNNNCMTISEANTLSIVGFCIFIIFIVFLLRIFVCVLYTHPLIMSDRSINIANELEIFQNTLLNEATQNSVNNTIILRNNILQNNTFELGQLLNNTLSYKIIPKQNNENNTNYITNNENNTNYVTNNTNNENNSNILCSVCLTYIQQKYALFPCGHTQLCKDCYKQLLIPKKCPLCQSKIIEIKPIFM